jgi:hypothetical protein
MIVDGIGNLPIFPCSADKRPLIKAWPTAAKHIEPLKHWPLVGMPTGEPSGISVLDVDVDGLAWFDARHLPLTRMHQTRSGGLHLLFRHAEGLRNSASAIAPDIDVRASGGYVVYWPREGLEVCDAPLAEWPGELGFRHHSPSHRPDRAALVTNSATANAATALHLEVPKPLYRAIIRLMRASTPKETRRVRTVLRELVQRRDGRNNGLFRAGICFRSLIAEGVIDEGAAAELLTLASTLNGYAAKAGAEAVEKTVRSALGSRPLG